MEQLYNQLLEQLADIERQQQDPTLSHSDQQLLDQAWEELNDRLDELDDILDTATVEWRDATEYLEEDDDDTTSSGTKAFDFRAFQLLQEVSQQQQQQQQPQQRP